jgi:MoxR-like ATPase
MHSEPNPDLQQITHWRAALLAEVAKVMVGNEAAVESLIIALFAQGHVLLEGVPGTAKTLMVRALAAAVGLDFGRIQFTPDLMPSDIVGTHVFDLRAGAFRLTKGPVFTEVLLADEINRAPAKTQSALLEAMQERQVSIDGERHPLSDCFVVFATQNPVEHEGTYPLPEAQLDRFLFKLRVGYPSAEVEARLLGDAHRRPLNASPADLGVTPVSSPAELLDLRARVLTVDVRADLPAYVVSLVRATRSEGSLVLGASPRAGVMLVLASKARAALQARDYVTPDDIKAVFLPALRHRVILDPAEEIEGGTTDDVLRRILDRVEVPR